MISRAQAILLTLFGMFLGGILVYLSPTLNNPNLDLEFWAYIAGTMIAICALFITIWQVRTTIKHNKLTNKPHLQLHNHILSKELAIEVFVTNDGLGPAVVNSSKYIYKNHEVPGNGVAKTDLLLKAMFNGLDFIPMVSHLDNGLMIPSGKKIMLFRVDLKACLKDESAFIDLWNQIKGSTQIIIEFQSVYGDKDDLNDWIND